MTEVRLYKFLDGQGACPVSGQVWPQPQTAQPGAWLERSGDLDPEGLGFLVFPEPDLAPWASTQLYRVEVSGELGDQAGAVCAPRVRLVEPQPAWPEIATALMQMAQARTRSLVSRYPQLCEYGNDVASCVEYAMVNGVLFISALVHALVAELDANTANVTDAHATHATNARRDAFLSERQLQSRFIAERLAFAS